MFFFVQSCLGCFTAMVASPNIQYTVLIVIRVLACDYAVINLIPLMELGAISKIFALWAVSNVYVMRYFLLFNPTIIYRACGWSHPGR